MDASGIWLVAFSLPLLALVVFRFFLAAAPSAVFSLSLALAADSSASVRFLLAVTALVGSLVRISPCTDVFPSVSVRALGRLLLDNGYEYYLVLSLLLGTASIAVITDGA